MIGSILGCVAKLRVRIVVGVCRKKLAKIGEGDQENDRLLAKTQKVLLCLMYARTNFVKAVRPLLEFLSAFIFSLTVFLFLFGSTLSPICWVV
jgi:hypothetical protein